jgi:hypothetical protein
MTSLANLFSQGYEICRITATDHWGVLSGLFLTGLVGSLAHCSGMCGPFVLSQVGARMEHLPLDKMSEWRRATGAILLPYHLGRMTTYCVLGTLAAGALGHLAGGGVALQWASAVLLSLAAISLITVAFPKLGQALFPHWKWETHWAGWVTSKAKKLFDNPIGLQGYGLGVVLGFIPCGLLYAALSSAASSGDWLAGALGMAAFTLGTMPMLVFVGVLGHVAAGVWRKPALEISPWLLLANGFVLGGLAVTMMVRIFDGGGTP